MTTLARRLGAFDATMLVMGGIIGSGIFMNPYVVARQMPSVPLILGVWAAGGAIALAGAFVYAELAALRPEVGGQYAYLRDAWHPSVCVFVPLRTPRQLMAVSAASVIVASNQSGEAMPVSSPA